MVRPHRIATIGDCIRRLSIGQRRRDAREKEKEEGKRAIDLYILPFSDGLIDVVFDLLYIKFHLYDEISKK
ncbi:hypothetical protein HZH66_004811 [Vespula vulgaris]|uniref:Uncharacterized protein n=1 Tax=Vespula vulgaris TaxID=7454 RepID=A0A834NBY9_VESVU|nr:hypothetical protein HZH66_004811 [Vespula vulgaris]